jgi:hypothetical protein
LDRCPHCERRPRGLPCPSPRASPRICHTSTCGAFVTSRLRWNVAQAPRDRSKSVTKRDRTSADDFGPGSVCLQLSPTWPDTTWPRGFWPAAGSPPGRPHCPTFGIAAGHLPVSASQKGASPPAIPMVPSHLPPRRGPEAERRPPHGHWQLCDRDKPQGRGANRHPPPLALAS